MLSKCDSMKQDTIPFASINKVNIQLPSSAILMNIPTDRFWLLPASVIPLIKSRTGKLRHSERWRS